jgi:hypothetical protein
MYNTVIVAALVVSASAAVSAQSGPCDETWCVANCQKFAPCGGPDPPASAGCGSAAARSCFDKCSGCPHGETAANIALPAYLIPPTPFNAQRKGPVARFVGGRRGSIVEPAASLPAGYNETYGFPDGIGALIIEGPFPYKVSNADHTPLPTQLLPPALAPPPPALAHSATLPPFLPPQERPLYLEQDEPDWSVRHDHRSRDIPEEEWVQLPAGRQPVR